ncbi:hypothetical protein ETD83_29315 [Actinomadura soli]|uniref:Uncharacterized protein n=1 Tax=Actinomadura soli TaxID=2508997 RepID=A0A5C4J4M3_9ACTN|nr:hypothetical protein [Actinomadura soli]TMQ91781.1 hypothetical protein ETD83_29315 [Actinomadura soli]
MTGAPGFRAMFRGLAVVLGCALVAAGCTTQERERAPGPLGGPHPPPAGTSARLVQPFGVKWNGYAYPPRYGPVIDSYRGGGTFHDITWCGVERARGRQRWQAEDKVVDDALRRGYELLVRIRIGSCWASGRAPSSAPRISASYPPADLDAYRGFVRSLVTRYAAKGVHLYAIENEIDTVNHWGADPAAYPPVARAGAAAVRDADPRARLADAGLSSSGYGLAVAKAWADAGRQRPAVSFYQAFYERRRNGRLPEVWDGNGLRAAFASSTGRRILAAHEAVTGLDKARVFDIYQLHYYDPWRLAGHVVDEIRRRVPPGMPIEAWEAGSFWPGPDYDAAGHAGETVRLASDLLARGVRRVVYLPLFHTPGAVAPKETWRGLYAADGTARPAAEALRRLRESTGSGTWRPYDRAGLRGAAVDRGPSTTLVLWSADGRARRLTAPPGPAAEIVPLPVGEPRTWDDGGLELSADPVVISTRTPLPATLDWLNGNAG